MAELTLAAEVRDGRGKGAARKLRALGKVPATLYGRGIDPVSLSVDARTLGHTLATDAGLNVLIDLQFDGQTHLTLARDIDKHPVKGHFIHVDFMKIARDVAITVDVPVHLDGESRGVKEGGVLEHHLWQIHVECLPGNVPERINFDVSNLAIGDLLRVSDASVPEGVTILNSEEEIVVGCIVPQVMKVEAELEEVPLEGEAAEAAAAAAAAAEPEGEAPAPEAKGDES